VSDQDEAYFPLSLAELERNLRAVVAVKMQRAEAIDAAAAAVTGTVAAVEDDAADSEPKE
jgi:hypothetical protein